MMSIRVKKSHPSTNAYPNHSSAREWDEDDSRSAEALNVSTLHAHYCVPLHNIVSIVYMCLGCQMCEADETCD
jgi:hypothetical protein